MFQSNGQKTGTAAALLGDLAVGACFDSCCVRVAVDGVSPSAGKIHAISLDTKTVSEMDAAQPAAVEHVGTLTFLALSDTLICGEAQTPAASTFGDVEVGALCDLSVAPSTPGDALIKVTGPVEPAAGFGWAFNLRTFAVVQVADETPVESWGAAAIATAKVQ